MPTTQEWVAPEIVCWADGPGGPVTAYRCYEDDDLGRPLTYWFTTDLEEPGDHEFDIRDLAASRGEVTEFSLTGPGLEAAKRVILAAIASGDVANGKMAAEYVDGGDVVAAIDSQGA